MQKQALAVFTTNIAGDEALKAIKRLCQNSGIGSGQQLSEDNADCFALQAEAPPELDFKRLRDMAEEKAIDVNLITTEDRRKKLLIADLDATIIRGESLDELASLAGIGEEIKAITARTMAGELDFEAGLSARLQLLKGYSAELLDEVIKNTQITPGAVELVATMRANGAECFLISGGFTFLTSVIAKRLNFTGHHANQLGLEKGLLNGKAFSPILGKQAKYDYLHHYCDKYGLSTDLALAVGDGANDMMMLKAAGLGVAFEGKPALRAQIPVQISHSDLSALLYLQGYSSTEFKR